MTTFDHFGHFDTLLDQIDPVLAHLKSQASILSGVSNLTANPYHARARRYIVGKTRGLPPYEDLFWDPPEQDLPDLNVVKQDPVLGDLLGWSKMG